MDNSLQNKLTSFEETPPTGSWDKIAAALDDQEHFATRLFNYSQDAPPTVWNRIEKSLENEGSAGKIIPFSTRYKKFIPFIAAASILAIIALSTVLFLRDKEAGDLQAGNKNTAPLTPQTTVPLQQNRTQPINTEAALNPSVGVTITKPTTFKKRLLNLIQPQGHLTSIAVARKFIPGNVIKEALFNNRSLDNYMVFSDGNGMALRMPKKLFPLVQCQDGDGSCRQLIKSLQKKISSASLNTDFGAVIEMLHQVQ